jgi:hypothetical protein
LKAFVTSIGEPTTELCVWSLERNGFEVVLLQNDTSLANKLKRIYGAADFDFVRVDADVIVNNQFTPEIVRAACPSDKWWVQFKSFGWYRQNVIFGGSQFIKKEALSSLRNNIEAHLEAERPESQMFRLPEFHNPRRCISNHLVMGIHGYGIRDYSYVKATKERRRQTGYDWELVERLNQL